MKRDTRDNLQIIGSESEAREKGRLGGIASGKSRRLRRTLREELQALLDMPVKGKDGKVETRRERISAALIKQAEKGDVKAFKAIAETIGEKAPLAIDLKARHEAEVSLGDMDVEAVALFLADVKKGADE